MVMPRCLEISLDRSVLIWKNINRVSILFKGEVFDKKKKNVLVKYLYTNKAPVTFLVS